MIDTLPRFPGPRDRATSPADNYLTKPEINALYFATHKMGRPRGWDALIRSAGTRRTPWLCSSTTASIPGPSGGPRRPTSRYFWRHVIWDRKSPDREAKERSPLGVAVLPPGEDRQGVYRPMNRVVHAHLRSLMPEDLHPRGPRSSGIGIYTTAGFL